MRSTRRLTKLEAGLPPQAAALLWLDQAHRHGSLDAFLASLVDEAGPSPLVALVERVAAATRAAHAREPRPTVREAERRAVMDTVFLVMLILELERETTEAIRGGSLRHEALRWEQRARIAEGRADRRGWTAWRGAVLDLATDIARIEAVRLMLAERHLDGREILFPDTLAPWQELREAVTSLVVAMASVPRAGHTRRADARAIDACSQRVVAQAAAGLIERVRARVLELMGGHQGAIVSAERQLR